MATLADLAERLTVRARELDQVASIKTVTAGTAILRELAQVTPVDTTQAVSNWQVSINTPDVAKIPPYFPGKKGSSAGASRAEMVRVGLETMQTKQPGDTLHIVNVLPYIRRLNDGYSAQAPAGFVERCVLIGRQFGVTVRQV